MRWILLVLLAPWLTLACRSAEQRSPPRAGVPVGSDVGGPRDAASVAAADDPRNIVADAGPRAADAHIADAASNEPPVTVRGARAATRLFVVGTVMRFTVVDVVDTHDPSAGGPTRTDGEVTATVSEVRGSGPSVVAEIAWTSPDELDWFRPPKRWLLRDGSLWTLDGPLAPEGETDEALARTPPVLSARDAARGAKSCRESKDVGPYGPSLVRVCFDGQGLLSWLEQNRDGPRRVSLVRK